VDFTALAATSVLDDLIVFCPPARACRDAFSRMTKATIKMGLATTGFGQATQLNSSTAVDPQLPFYTHLATSIQQFLSPPQSLDPNNPNFPYAPPRSRRPVFDTDLQGLFSKEETAGMHQTMRNEGTPNPPNPPNPQGSSNTAFRGDDAKPLAYQGAFGGPPAAGVDPSLQQYAQMALSPWSELDFLDSVSIPDTLNVNSNDPAVDPLGLGFTWDGSVPGADWGDGSGSVDVFDGFFFGGSGMTGFGGANDMDMSGQ
jgi:hypothetical protein